MSIVKDIVEAFGSQVAMADATGISQQTISEWVTREPPEIPPWRRPVVLHAASRTKGVTLEPEHLAYLASTERTPRAPRQAQAA